MHDYLICVALLEFGSRLMKVQMSPTVLGIYRAVMAEALRLPYRARWLMND
jgi:hypothetical protein